MSLLKNGSLLRFVSDKVNGFEITSQMEVNMSLLRWDPKPSKRIRDTSSSQQTHNNSSQNTNNGSNQS